jgi:hypothetical protein
MGNGSCAERMQSLAKCRDVAALTSAVRELCSEFGNLTNINVLTMAEAERRRALCFLRLESEAQEQRLMATLSAIRFGNDVLLVVDLPRDAPAASLETARI